MEKTRKAIENDLKRGFVKHWLNDVSIFGPLCPRIEHNHTSQNSTQQRRDLEVQRFVKLRRKLDFVYVWSKTEILFFFWRKAQPPLELWLRTLQCEWKNILPRTPSICFLLDSNALRLSLHLGRICCKGNREMNQVRCDCSFFYFLLVASLRFGLVYLCVQFVFSAAALHFLVRWVSRF